eukprot:EG_transcript_27546
MGGGPSKPPANGGVSPAPPEAVQFAAMDTGALMPPSVSELADAKAVELAVGMLTERLYCPAAARGFQQCVQTAGLADQQAAAAGPCRATHEALRDCMTKGNVQETTQRFLWHFATEKCAEKVQAARACTQRGGVCQDEALQAYGCGGRHVITLMSAVETS